MKYFLGRALLGTLVSKKVAQIFFVWRREKYNKEMRRLLGRTFRSVDNNFVASPPKPFAAVQPAFEMAKTVDVNSLIRLPSSQRDAQW